MDFGRIFISSILNASIEVAGIANKIPNRRYRAKEPARDEAVGHLGVRVARARPAGQANTCTRKCVRTEIPRDREPSIS